MVRFLTAEGVFQQEISRRMTAVYGEHCISLATVKRWSKRFREGRESCKDDPRPGQSHLAITPNTIAQVDELIGQQSSSGKHCNILHTAHFRETEKTSHGYQIRVGRRREGVSYRLFESAAQGVL